MVCELYLNKTVIKNVNDNTWKRKLEGKNVFEEVGLWVIKFCFPVCSSCYSYVSFVQGDKLF